MISLKVGDGFPLVRWSAPFLLALAMTIGTAAAQEPGEYGNNYDRRLRMIRPESVTPRAGQMTALSRFRAQLDGSLLVSFDADSGVTRTLFNPVGKLTSVQAGDPLEAALAFVESNLALLGLQEGDLDELEVCDLVYSRVSDSTHIYLCQKYQDLPIYNAQLQINLSGDGSILSVNNSFVPGLRTLAKVPDAGIGAPDSVLAAANHLGAGSIPRPRARPGEPGPPRRQRRASMTSRISTESIDAELMWLPSGRDLNLVWWFRIHTPDGQHVYEFTVDAETGPPSNDASRVWTRFDLMSSDQYRVYPLPVESPFHTTPAPPADARTLVVNPSDATASMLGWHSTGSTNYTIMRGNNVHAYEDGDNDDQPPAVQPDCGVSLNCDFPINLNQDPSAYTNASVANLFYWNNIVHDVQYQYGFDEQAGNFQVNNFGLGGAGGDDVRAEAQDGGGINNANFLTLPDGTRPRMQMYLWDQSTPMRDGSFDHGIVVHEYGHGISIRLVGGPSNVTCLQNNQQPGEGLSDWWALAYTARVGDQGTDVRGIGAYVYSQNGDVGVRTQPYSTDPTVNTHTYESINGMAVPHGVGEVWAQAAWEAYWALVQTHGFDPDLYNAMGGAGNQRMMLYVNEGLKNTACSPAFTDVRDGIIQAAVDNYGGQDVCTLWNAFADFGLGVDAVSGGSNSTSPTNGFDVPIQCKGGTLHGIVESNVGVPIQGATVEAGGYSAVTSADGSYSLDLPAGTYDATASAFGFDPSTVSGVVIAIGSDVVADFVLTARPQAPVSGTVTDGSAAGWPLYARVDITAQTPQTTQTVYTHPATGQYGPVSLVQGENYDIVVTSILPGYVADSRSVTATASPLTEDFPLRVDSESCAAPGYTYGTTVFASEGFEGSFPPAGWTVSHSTTGCSAPGLPEWTNTDPGGRNNFTGGSGLFAVADADACGFNVSMDTVLESPQLDLSGLGGGETLRIEFKHLFTQFSGDETADVDIWDGSSWVNLQGYGGGGFAAGTVLIETPDYNGVSDAKLRFHYAAGYDFWWQLDDVQLSVGPGAPQCSFQGGGLIWGQVTEEGTGSSINGATVTVTGGSSAQTVATPHDPNLDDGFYLLHADAGLQTVTASASGYGDASSDVTVPEGGVVELNLPLPMEPTIRFSAGAFSVSEGDGVAIIAVSRSGSTSGAITVDYATSNGGATEGADYSAASGTLSFADGDSDDKTFAVLILEDSVSEGDETVVLTLSNPSGAVLGSPATAVLTILDNEIFVETVWVEDTVPLGASVFGTWNWVSSNPSPFSGALSHQSTLAAGMHQHYFLNATQTLMVEPGDTLFSYIYIDPANPPRQIMMQWNDGTWDHRAYWGDNLLPWGTDGTNSRRFMGPLPPLGVWVRLQVPANQVGLEGKIVNGMAFSLYDGLATWDYTGKSALPPAPSVQFGSATYTVIENGVQATINVTRTGSANGAITIDYATSDGSATAGADYSPTSGTLSFADGDTADKTFVVSITDDGLVEGAETVTLTLSNPTGGVILGSPNAAVLTITDNDVPAETVWVEDTTPAGATLSGTWNWIDASPEPYSGSFSHQSSLAAGMHQHFFIDATETLSVGTGETLFAYVYLDPANPPSEIMLQWNDGTWEHRAYWGENKITGSYWGVDGTESRLHIGPLPSTGQWVRLDVLAGEVGLEGKVLNGMAFTLYEGRATWDYAGKSIYPPPSVVQLSSPVYSVSEGGSQATITVTRSRTSTGSVTVDYEVSDGTATAGTDYAATSGTISFADGDIADKSFVVPILEDALAEGAEAAHIDLLNPTGAVLGVTSSAVLTILDNEALPETVWVEDTTPAGASLSGVWNWIGSSPTPFSGSLAHQSLLSAGGHHHFFINASETLSVGPGDTLFTYVYLDPINPPTQIMLQWNDGTWDHRAYWGADKLPWGTNGTESRLFMGPLPTTGEWVRLEVPANYVGLEGKVLNGMSYDLFDGRVTWDYSGKTSAPPPPSVQFGSATYTVSEDGAQATINVMRIGGASGVVSVDYATAEGTATAGADYASASGTLSFANGDTTDKTFVVSITDDGLTEGDETVNLTLSNPSGAILGDPNVAVLTISDNDVPPETVWVEDDAPAGATLLGTWNWIGSNPDPFSGALAHQSTVVATLHQHYFINATETLAVGVGETLFTYAYLDPANPPSEIMLQWNDGTWEHRAYWGANSITFGTDGTQSRRYIGPLPPTGQWVRLDVAASEVGLEGKVLSGMAFTLYGGRVTWDYTGKSIHPPQSVVQLSSPTFRVAEGGVEATITVTRNRGSAGDISVDYTVSDGTATAGGDYTATSGTIRFADGDGADKTFVVPILEDGLMEGVETIQIALGNPIGASLGVPSNAVLTIMDNEALLEAIWVEDATPAGSSLYGFWNWIGDNPVPYSGSLAHQSQLYSGAHQHYFWNATETMAVGPGDTLFSYVYLDPANPPTQIMLQWNDGTWEHRAYWGANNLPWGVDGTEGGRFMGPLPPTGQWARLEVPAHEVGLEGTILNGMSFDLYGGRATWDYAGKSGPPPPPTIQFEAGTYTVAEDGVQADITVTRVGNASGAVSVDYGTTDGTATAGADYTAASGTITFGDGDTTDRTIVVTILEDAEIEGEETVDLALSNPTGGAVLGGTDTTVLTILDNDIPETLWLEDSVPAGALQYGSWNWIDNDPAPFSGTLAHQSTLYPSVHQHYFLYAQDTLSVAVGDTIFTYVYLDPANPPLEVMLQWNDGSWEHRAYWGANKIYWGMNGTASRRFMGPLPATGQWVRLEVAASQVSLEGRTVSGMAFTLYGGRATWDRTGVASAPSQ